MHENKIAPEKIALICHEANRAYCIAVGDSSQTDWFDAPEWQRDSAVNGVKHKLANPEATPEAMHENWWKEKREAGWVYGEVKDQEKKTHPCCVPYAELPKFQKLKDELFTAIVEVFR